MTCSLNITVVLSRKYVPIGKGFYLIWMSCILSHMDNSEIIGIFFLCNFGHCCGHYYVLRKFWFLEKALILLVISFFFIVDVKEAYCYVVNHHKQAVFVSERLLIQTCPEREHMPWLNNNRSWGDVTKNNVQQTPCL